MKRLIPILILFVVALAPAAQTIDPASYWNAWALFFTGADGKPSAVTPSNKLPVDALVTIGSISAEIDLPRDGDNTPYFSLSQVASDALTLFNAWFAAANLDRLASTSEGLKVVATGVVRVSEIPAVTGTVDVGNFPSDQTVTLSNSLGSTSNPITATGTVQIGNLPAGPTVSTDADDRIDVNIASYSAGNIPVVATIPEAISVANFPSTQTVALAPSVAFTQTALSATNTATLYTTSAGCESVSLFNLGSTTIWFSLDGAGATVSAGIPLTATDTLQQQQSFSCGPNKAIYYIASNTTAFTILESGR